ncbi:MAG: M14 family zinc carboxypeptidase, partial [Pseudomonadales bacterium]
PLGKVLVLGGIHGDEFSSVSVLFKWLKILDQHHSGLFHWRFVPVVNPDGLLQTKSQRQNSNGVDLNRNFPTTDWNTDAHRYWREKTYRNPRRYPGTGPASEVETQWVLEQLASFDPDVVISMHAPYHLVDYDGPPRAPENLGGLYLRKLGVYPGSLGNYVGVDLNKPIVTVELKSAGIMPTKTEIESMWSDLVVWLRQQLGE